MSKPDKPSKRRTFLDPAKIEEALFEVAGVANQEGVEIALAGGCALQLYGSDRFTQDVDLVAGARLVGLRSKGPLAIGGVRLATRRGVPVDLIVRRDQYADLYASALAAAQKIRGIPVRIVTLPYLAAMKLAAGRGKDELDLEFILCDSGAPWDAIKRVVREQLGLYATEEISAIRDTAKWQRKLRR